MLPSKSEIYLPMIFSDGPRFGCQVDCDIRGIVADKKNNSTLIYYDGPQDALKVCMLPMVYLPVIVR